MKQTFLIVCALFVAIFSSFSQNVTPDFFANKSNQEIIQWQKKAGDKWFNENVDSWLKVGDKMPDIPLGTVTNNKTGKTMFSEFKGKVVILDFWTTGCHACISLFPHMADLQRQFRDKLQVFIVNPSEIKEKIDQRLKRQGVILPDLPSIVEAESLSKLFPIRYVPVHVIIDPKGIIRVIGDPANSNPTKVQELLNEVVTTSLNSLSTSPLINRKIPYYKLMGIPINPLKYNSYFLPFNNYYGASSVSDDAYPYEIVDSFNNTIRNTFINHSVARLYYQALKERIDKNIKSIIYGIHPGGSSYLSYIKLKVRDTLNYSFHFVDWKTLTDKTAIQSKFCYEQITPPQLSAKQRTDSMLRDLNTYFGKLYGVHGELKNIKTKYFALVRISDVDKVKVVRKITSEDNRGEHISYSDNGNKFIKFTNNSLLSLFQQAIQQGYIPAVVFQRSEQNKSALFLDETTGFTPGVFKDGTYNIVYEIIFPDKGKIKTMEELRALLNRYDLDIVYKEKDMPFISLTESGRP